MSVIVSTDERNSTPSCWVFALLSAWSARVAYHTPRAADPGVDPADVQEVREASCGEGCRAGNAHRGQPSTARP